MSELWKQWEGQVADHKYLLQQFLGSTDHSVVFLAEFHGPEPRPAAVKFISADLVNAEQQLAAWNRAAQLSHPNLLRIYASGRCKIEDMDLLYVAMEHAEENLAQVLPQRALMAEETRDMLNSVVDALVYLHGKNLTHGHIKPSNILALGDSLKLSSDTIFPSGELREMRRERSAYDAPELPDSSYTLAADVWSLGVTLVEALTQQPAVLPFNEEADPVIPSTVREPFLEIARHTLRREPKLRWSSSKIAERLNPAAAGKAAAAAASAVAAVSPVLSTAVAPPDAGAPISPLQVPLSKEPAIPLAKLSSAPAHATVVPPPSRIAPNPARQTVLLPNYVIPVFAGALALIALIMLPKVLRHRQMAAPQAVSSVAPSVVSNTPPAPSSSSTSRVETPAKHSAEAPTVAHLGTPPVAPAILRSSEKNPTPTPRASSDSPERGQALDQVIPEASARALASIRGTVRVVVKVHVDAAGNVSEATLDNPGPSKYFADLSLKAARRWVFSSPEAEGHSSPSDWLIQYFFTSSGVKASANQFQP
jgi:serine/threonine protein kinase